MCGIIGYIGQKQAFPILIKGLKRLEYRGYDSYGFFVLGPRGEKFLFKDVGKISRAGRELDKLGIKGNIGIAHTRWATTGAITKSNAHPHFDSKKEIFLVHNGIIENYKELKKQLIEEGHHFVSETDTEVIAHLIEKYYRGNLEKAVAQALEKIRGTYGLAVVSAREPNKIVAARLSSPLLIGVGKDEFIIASDASAIIDKTKRVIILNDNEIAVIHPHKIVILKNKKVQNQRIELITWSNEQAQKKGYPHFMLKEIMEIPETIRNAIRGRIIKNKGLVKLGGLQDETNRLKHIEETILIGCGTSSYAAMIGSTMIEEFAGISSKFDVGSEFRYRNPHLDKNDLAIFLSQSGETADTLAALRKAKKQKVLTLGITNVVGSSQSRETDIGIYTRSGPEIAVASTKSLIGQISVLILLTVFLARQRKMSLKEAKSILGHLEELPLLAETVLKQRKNVDKIAKNYSKFSNFVFLGRKYNYPIALEGALKLKEVSYIPSEGLAAGEMKHGPLALINKNFPSVVICPSDSVYEKVVNNIEEIKTRHGPIIAIATEGNKEIKKLVDDIVYIPKTLELLNPILVVIILQLFAYYMAVRLGRDVDKPRNLAKSVTVE